MTSWLRDLRHAARGLRKTPGFAVAALVTLALAVGGTTAVFSVVRGVVLRPLPFAEPHELVRLYTTNEGLGLDPAGASWPDFVDWRREGAAFEDLAALLHADASLTGREAPERVRAGYVSAALFPLLGVEAAHGRTFRPEEDAGSGERVVLLSHALWLRRFGGDPGVLGHSLGIEGSPHVVVGVLPPHFELIEGADVWAPITTVTNDWTNRSGRPIAVVGRLADGVSRASAAAQMDALARALERRHPESNSGFRIAVRDLTGDVVTAVRPTLLLVLAAVSLILLIGCANLANLLLARNSARGREIAIRAALGAGRVRLARLLLSEAAVLACAGGVAGVLLASAATDLILAAAPAGIPRLHEVRIDRGVLGFALLITLVAAALFGVVPAVVASRHAPAAALAESRRGVGLVRGRRFRRALVACQVALAVVLVTATSLFARSLEALLDVEPGFRAQGAWSAGLSLPEARYADPAARADFARRLLERLEPAGWEAAGLVSQRPLSGEGTSSSVLLPERPAATRAEAPKVDYREITPGYFHAIGIPLLAGRTFAAGDDADAAPVAIVNAALARRFWPGEDAVGKRIGLFADGVQREIVGVVGDVRHDALDLDPKPELYLPYFQSSDFTSLHLVVRAGGDAAAVAATVRESVRALDADAPVGELLPLERVVRASVGVPRFRTVLIALFAVIALALGAVGIHGAVSLSVHQRTREIGLRLALGARPHDVLAWTLRGGLGPVLVGIAAGMPLALGAARLLRGLLYGVGPADAVTAAAVPAVLVATAIAAAWRPARRASRVDPLTTLRLD